MRTLIFFAALSTAITAAADEPRSKFYLLAGGGMARSSASTAAASNAQLAASGFTVTSSSETSDDSAYTIGAGYVVSRHLLLETAYTNLGDVHHYQASFNVPGGNIGARSKDHSGHGLQLSAIGVLPIGEHFALLGKLSALAFKGELRAATSIFTPPPNSVLVSSTQDATSGSGVLPGIGIGVALELGAGADLRFMLERWRTKSGMFGAGNDLDSLGLLSITVTYRF